MVNNLEQLFNELFTLVNPSNIEEKILITIKDNQFSGAIIPMNKNYYVIASSQNEFRILISLISSFVGKTYSNFDGHLISLNQEIPVEKLLLNYNFTLVSKFEINEMFKQTIDLLLIKMIQVCKSSNTSLNLINMSIGKMIDNFKEFIYITKDINNAKNIIRKIKQEHRLDAMNINFMEIELSYAFQNWDEIINHKLIFQIINARKPLTIRLHIIEAFFYSYIFNSINVEKDYNNYIKPHILNLLINCPLNVRNEIKYIYLLAYSFDDIEYSNINFIVNYYENNPFLTENDKSRIKNKLSLGNKTILQDNDNLFLSTKSSIIEANNVDTLVKINSAVVKLNKLNEEDQKELSPKLLSNEVTDNLNYIPKNWIEWIELLSDERFTNSLLVAEKGLEEWDINILTNNPVNKSNFCEKINLLNTQDSISRFIRALPLFVEALKRAGHYPNLLYLDIYISILETISKYELQDQNILILTQDIFESLLILNLNNNVYDNILQIFEIIIQQINGKFYIDYLIDFAEGLLSYNVLNSLSRNKLLELILMKVYEQKDLLEEFHLDMLIKLSSTIELNFLFENLKDEKIQTEDELQRYIGKTIGIHTLFESAAKNAKKYLEDKIENVRVILNHDKAMTTTLKYVAEVSDYMVIVTQSAKHAATGEIQKIRRLNNKEVLFPLGKGSSSILSILLTKE